MGQWGRKDQQGAFGWAEAVCFDIGVPRLLESGQMSLLEQLAWNGDLHGCKPDFWVFFLKFISSSYLSYSEPWKEKQSRKMARSVLKLQLLVGLGLHPFCEGFHFVCHCSFALSLTRSAVLTLAVGSPLLTTAPFMHR